MEIKLGKNKMDNKPDVDEKKWRRLDIRKLFEKRDEQS